MSIEVAYFKTFVMIQGYKENCSPIGGIFEVVIFQKASRNNQLYIYIRHLTEVFALMKSLGAHGYKSTMLPSSGSRF